MVVKKISDSHLQVIDVAVLVSISYIVPIMIISFR